MTDYTTLAAVKRALGSAETADDVLLTELITQASRTIDRYCAGVGYDNYFVKETLTVTIPGRVSADGRLICWLQKPVVESVSSLEYRYSPRENWQVLDVSGLQINGYSVSGVGLFSKGTVHVKIIFTGGFDPLPDDLINAATLLTVRFYREIKSGLTDSIGVAELGMLQYTKALPERLLAMLRPYKRVVQ